MRRISRIIQSTLLIGSVTVTIAHAAPQVLESYETPAYYERLAKFSQAPESYMLLLKAADIEFSQDNEDALLDLLNQVPDKVSPIVDAHKNILIAEIKLKRDDNPGALKELESLNAFQNLPLHLAARYYTVRAIAYQNTSQFLASAQERVFLEPLLKSDPERLLENHQAIWSTLSQLPVHVLKLTKIAPPPDPFGGWLALIYITKEYAATPEQQAKAITAWRKTYFNHPGNTMIGAPITPKIEAPAATTTSSEKVALLLPFSGAYQSAGEAIREGFMAGYYATKTDKPSIKIYDTTQYSSMSQLYRQVTEDGATMIVGPLSKEDLKQIASFSNRELKLPMIALNTPDDNRKGLDHLFTFSLQPESEAISVADKLLSDGRHHAIVLAASTNAQKRSESAFNARFTSLGGQVLHTTQIPAQADLAQSVTHLLQIDESQKRAQALKKTLARKIEFQPRRRQDIEAVVLMSSPDQARQLRPLFDFYYAQDLPLYATSSIYTGEPNADKDRDMNRITFCDMPWILDNNHPLSEIKASLQTLWADKMDKEARLFAFGLDAYQLSGQLHHLSGSPQAQLLGATGQLSIGENHAVERKLTWARIQNGVPKLI